MKRIASSLVLASLLAFTGCGDDDDDDNGNGGNNGNNPTPEMTPDTTPDPTPQMTPAMSPDPTPQMTPAMSPDPTPQMTPVMSPDPTPDPTGPQPRGAGNRPELGMQIDRAGRPAINTALNATFEADAAVKNAAKDAYNEAAPDEWANFRDAFMGSLAILDSLDTVCGNQLLAGDTAEAGRYGALADVLVDDQLYVHADRNTCGVYLGLEAEFVGAVNEGDGGCGGRSLTDDVIERSYSVLAAGALTGVDDGITADDVEHPDGFPYLGEPSAPDNR